MMTSVADLLHLGFQNCLPVFAAIIRPHNLEVRGFGVKKFSNRPELDGLSRTFDVPAQLPDGPLYLQHAIGGLGSRTGYCRVAIFAVSLS